MAFTRRVGFERYRLRSSAQYPGDRVTRTAREINGKRFEFSHIVWGDGSITVRAYLGDSAEPFREWSTRGMWTDPAYLDS